ncbi:MAG: hypothetical protein RIN55_03275 [Tissierellaceae bacterium]|nr:hypothetical protein [Tissierellaceae bacterium]
MKKHIFLFVLVLLMISITACSGSNLENYVAAIEKTNSMVKGSDSMEMSIVTKYNTVGLEEDVQKLIQSFEQSKFTMTGSFDNDLKKSRKIGYLNYGNLGFDFNIYGVDDAYYIEPFFLELKDHRYIEFSLDEFKVPESEIPSEFFQEIGKKWNEIISEENVMRGEKVLVTTDDGEIKSREFTITLNEEQLKEFILYIIELFEENGEYLNIMDQVTYIETDVELTEEDKENLYRDLFTGLKDFIDKSDDLNLFYKAYIDIDGYVVQEDIEFNMGNEAGKAGELINLSFSMVTKYWDIEKEQDLDFDITSFDNSIRFDKLNLEELMPYREVK